MKLLNDEILKEFRRIGSQSDDENPIVVCKFFNPTGAGTWFATEFDEETKIFFGYASIFGNECDEWGSFSLYELESFIGRFGLGIERDLYFYQKRFNIIKEQLYGKNN